VAVAQIGPKSLLLMGKHTRSQEEFNVMMVYKNAGPLRAVRQLGNQASILIWCMHRQEFTKQELVALSTSGNGVLHTSRNKVVPQSILGNADFQAKIGISSTGYSLQA
jgi:hypothetical protein